MFACYGFLTTFCTFSTSFFPKPNYLVLNSKCAEIEEELKNVTNSLKSLEAQTEKVGAFQTPLLLKPRYPYFYTGFKID